MLQKCIIQIILSYQNNEKLHKKNQYLNVDQNNNKTLTLPAVYRITINISPAKTYFPSLKRK
jgi:hypothetical protein